MSASSMNASGRRWRDVTNCMFSKQHDSDLPTRSWSVVSDLGLCWRRTFWAYSVKMCGHFMHSFVKSLFHDMPTDFYWSLFLFDSHKIVGPFFEMWCICSCCVGGNWWCLCGLLWYVAYVWVGLGMHFVQSVPPKQLVKLAVRMKLLSKYSLVCINPLLVL